MANLQVISRSLGHIVRNEAREPIPDLSLYRVRAPTARQVDPSERITSRRARRSPPRSLAEDIRAVSSTTISVVELVKWAP